MIFTCDSQYVAGAGAPKQPTKKECDECAGKEERGEGDEADTRRRLTAVS